MAPQFSRTTFQNRKCLVAAAMFAFLLPAERGLAELRPDEVAILAVRASRESRELAAYYAQARGIPESHICVIDVPPGKDLSREAWERSVRPAIRAWVADGKRQHQIRCFVTTWDVPLKIGRSNAHGLNEERTVYLQTERQLRRQRLLERVADARRVASAEDVRPIEDDGQPVATLAQAATDAFEAAKARLNKTEDLAVKKQGFERLMGLLAQIGGAASLSGTLASQQTSDPRQAAQRDQQVQLLRGQVVGLREGQLALELLPEAVERDEQVLSIVEKSAGLLGTLQWIDQQLPLIEKNETYSSFDSELSLLYWPNYPLLRWVPNVLHHQFDGSYTRWLKSTLMVSRLEAPTWELTRGLIDTAIEVEKTGLSGTMYLDARGMAKPAGASRGSYGDYDQSLRDLADVFKAHSERTVVLDNQGKLFQPGDCPQAALYCGWYSLSKYVDAFDWNRGAVAYHLASGEAATLRDPDSQVWCKRMLEDGVCATVGPVYEPYLAAFPRPDEFFTLLAGGRYSLVETYYRTKPFNSWVMVLVGDPLYRPFRERGELKVDGLPERLQKLLTPEQPASPTAPPEPSSPSEDANT